MVNKAWWCLLLGLGGAIGCSNETSRTGAHAAIVFDAGSASQDAIGPPDATGGDARIIVADAGSGFPDGGGSFPDAGGGFPDAGGGFPDAGGGFPDAGGGFPDAGGGFPDGGGGFPDAGGGFPDGGGGFPDGGGGFPDGGGSFPDGGAPDDPGESDGIDPIVDPTPIGMPDPLFDNCSDLAQRDAQGISTPDDNARGRSYECFARYVSRVGGPQTATQDPAFPAVDAFDGVIPYPTREDFDTAEYETSLFLAAAPPAPSEVLSILKDLDLQGIADGKYGCEPAKAGHVANPRSGDIWQYMYIPGIQAYDNVPFLTNNGTANRYVQAAEWGADSQNNINTFHFPVSEITRWRLFHYHNEADNTVGKAGGPVSKVFKKRKFFGPPGDIVGSVENYSLTTHRTTFENDKKEVRNLAAWASAATQADFIANPPKPGAGTFLAAGPVRPGGPQITAADFTAWYNGRIAEKAKGQFHWFLRNAAWVAAHSYYCRKPIFAHSGGGPVKMAILRLLDAYSEALPGQPMRKIRNRNNVIWRAYGLEEVLSKEIRTLVEGLPSYQNKLIIYNYVENTGNQKGSSTWRTLIKVEIENVGQAPLVKEYQDMHINVSPSNLGHAWIGWTPLYAGVFYSPKTFFPAY